jgi:hypothetical protein
MTNTRRPRRHEPTFAEKHNIQFDWHWRSVAALVYLIICLNDFVIMPVYRELAYNRMSTAEMVRVAQTMKEPAAQVETLKILKEDRPWTPLTNDMFHISFGAILGVAALPQNRRRRKYDGNDYATYGDDDDYGGPGPFGPGPSPYPQPYPYPYGQQPPQGQAASGAPTQASAPSPAPQAAAPVADGPSVDGSAATFVPSPSPTSSDQQPTE